MKGKLYEVYIQSSKNIASFLTLLKKKNAKLKYIEMDGQNLALLTDKKGLKLIRKYRRRYGLKISIDYFYDDQPLFNIVGSLYFLIFLILPFLCSFILWSVDVESNIPELNERIEQKLKKSSIVPYQLLMNLPDEAWIRQQIMEEEPSLSWVYFKRSGSTLTVYPMLSPPVQKGEMTSNEKYDLVAKTSGVITQFALTKGERAVRLFSTVRKGELIASGILKQGDRTVIVGAEGKVYADYWLEYRFSIPKKIQYKVRGDEQLHISFQRPMIEKGLFNIKNWHIIKTERKVKEIPVEIELHEKMEEDFLIPFLKMKLLSEVSSEAKIKNEKILQVTYDNDKVNGTILFLMNENIARKRLINQGD